MNTVIDKPQRTPIRQTPAPATSKGLARFRRKLLPASLSLLGLLAFSDAMAGGHVAANTTPTGGSVVGGSGSIMQNGLQTVVKQNSQLLALNWQSFNVGANASVLFKQPSFSAVALNRILDQNPSLIFGHVISNGQIFLINTHGIIFGSTAQMNVGGLVASTLDLTPTDFLASHFNLDANGGTAGVVNHGIIEAASGGSVSLVGGHVDNDGLIIANYGHINLDGADRAVLDFDGDGLIDVQVTGALAKRLNDDESAVVNKGTLQADSGTVVLQASAAKQLFTNLVNNTGVINAGGISTSGGVVRLVASGGNAVDSGSINVSGTHGGSVQVLSDQDVGVTGNIDASGTQGGGSIRVGGGYQGGEGLQTAQATYVGPTATLDADATQSGNGGSVVVWGNQVNNFFGSITARGGALDGNGGSVETSSHYGLDAQGSVDASAPHGVAGTWLLDPYDVTINNTATSNISVSGTTYTANGNSSVINNTSLSNALTGGTSVFVFTAPQGGTGNGNQNGDITVNAPISGASSGTGAASLYLEAAGSIILNSNITAASSSLPLNVYLWANYGGSAAGTSYSSNASCASKTNCIVQMKGADITTLGGNLDIETTGAVSVDSASSIATSGGSIGIGNNGATPSTVTLDGTLTGGSLIVNSTGTLTLGNDVTTTGAQTYNNQVTLGTSSVTLTGTSIGLGSGATGSSDTLTIDGNAVLGGTSTLGSLSVSGTSSLGGSISTSGTQEYTGAVTLTGNTTLTSTGGSSGDITFDSTLDSASGSPTPGPYALTAGGGVNTVHFDGAVGATQLLSALTVSAGSQADLGGSVSTQGAQDYTGAVQFNNAATYVLSGTTITMAAGATGATADVSFSGNANLAGTFNLDSLSVSGTSVLDGSITTGGTQSYSGAVTLGGTTTVDSTGSSGGVTFGSTVNNASSTAQALTAQAADGNVTFSGAVGSSSNGALSSLTTASSTFSATSLNIGSGGLSITTDNSAIAQGGAFTVTGASIFDAGSGTINLINGGNSFGGTVQLSGGNTAILANSALDFNTGTITGTLTASSKGAMTQSGTLSVSGAAIFTQNNTTAGTGQNIILGANNDFASSATFQAGTGAKIDNLSFTNTDLTPGTLTLPASITGNLTLDYANAPLELSGISVGGNLTASSGGALSQSAALTVTGTSSFTATGNDITLTSGNSFGGAVSLNGDNVQVTNDSGLVLGAGTITGTLAASSNGAITQTGVLNVTGAASFTQNDTTAGAGQDITLSGNNDFGSS
ncbi:MAG TPA: filamentous hemagglutinin N-terminal domain-containing protein, partial [Dyella sp.]|uniref:beta strand repeat-containing protein n=1 Tax=Dyella sp. TaxID=1869338 RepID=UPI002B7A37EB